MAAGEIPTEVVRFVESHIDTVPQLEALLLMWESSPRAWRVDEIAARVYVDGSAADRLVQDLRRRGLLDVDPAAGSYVFVREHEAAPTVALLAAAYRTHLIPITRLIHAKGTTGMQEFARAFQLKGDR